MTEVKGEEKVIEIPQAHLDIIQEELWKMRPGTTKLAIEEALCRVGVELAADSIQTSGLGAGLSARGGHVRFQTVVDEKTTYYMLVVASEEKVSEH